MPQLAQSREPILTLRLAVTSRRTLIAAALAVAALLPGCGESDQDGQAETPPPVASPEDFPNPKGRTLVELYKEYGAGGPVLSPSVSQLTPGRNRFGFGLFDRARAQIADAPAAVYVAPMGGGEARGPFPARYESLSVKPQFQSRGVAADPDSAKTVYVAEIPFQDSGRYEALGMARLDDRLVTAVSAGQPLKVVDEDPVPGVGDKAPRISTPTVESVGGDVQQIDTRVPPSSMHEVDFADVVGKKPVVLIFATPALCQSKVCGPVVDIAEQVKADHEGEAEFIHMEIFNDNQLELGYRPQVRAWKLPTEPWVFAIDRKGRIAARIEGAFSARELEAALKKATRD
jgi:hypothetical protein